MNRLLLPLTCLLGMGLGAGCGPTTIDPPPPRAPTVQSRPADRPSAPTASPVNAESFTWETPQDRPFAEFLRDKSGGMVRKASVGIERGGRFQVVLDRSVAPEDTLDLTKSLMAGARKDFPDRPIALGVFDPSGEIILRARYKVDQGIKYEIAHEPKAGGGRPTVEDEAKQPTATASASNRSGATESDRKFAAWAEDHGKAYLRYVEADLERHGRLWFGVTREVKPADVPDLTKSLLEGARQEFPKGELVATVFDPEGNKIGKAYLSGSSSIRWER